VEIVVPAIAQSPRATGRTLPWLLMIWSAAAGLVLVRLLAGVASAMRITRSAAESGGVLYSDRAATPMTWGFVRPVVILPSYAKEWSAADRELVIRHERAHIARHDWLWQTLSNALTALFWFHPLVWVANFQLRREAEAAVDDFLIANGAEPSDYAGRLLDVARRLNGISSPAGVIPMIRSSELEGRVRAILDPARRRTGAGVLARCLIVLAAIALIVPIAVTRQTVHAQGKVYKIGEGASQPRLIRKVEAEYTPEAKAAKIEGSVQLSTEISAEGTPENIRVVKSLDPGLDANAVTAVSHWKFQPGMKDGKPVAVYATIEVTFKLK
jgi:TonB family protein